MSLRAIEHPIHVEAPAAEVFRDRPLRLAVAGYSSVRDRAHPVWVAETLDALVRALGPSRVGLVSSCTTTRGSVDRIALEVAHAHDLPLLHVTCTAFVRAARASELSERSLRARWNSTPRFVLPDRDAYADAGARASNALCLFGGGGQSVADVSHALRRGHRVALLVDPALDAPPWDPKARRVSNAVRYLHEQSDAWSRRTAPPWPEIPAVLGPVRDAWDASWGALLRRFEAPGAQLAGDAAAFLGALSAPRGA